MVLLIIYFTVLLISIGAVAGSILIANYLRKSYSVAYIESYFYYTILMCVFGIYGIWGLVFIKIVFDQITISINVITVLSQVIPYLGFPFLIMAWYMFLKFCYEISGSNISRSVSIVYFLFHFTFFIGLGWSILQLDGDMLEISRIGLIYIYILLDVILTFWGLSVLLIRTRTIFPDETNTMYTYILITFSTLLLKVASVVTFYFVPASIPSFILIYFLSVIGPLLYLYYNINTLISSAPAGQYSTSYESLIARYGISKREREIIDQVCAGKSNQEIADTLFISLQTVKDHTHRIYLKMDIKSRVQLIKMMQIEEGV